MERKEEVKKHKSISYRRDYNKLPGDVKKRYEEKIRLCGGLDPYSIKEKDMSLILKDFPVITVSDIANYMISSTSPYTKLPFNAYKSTEAYKFFESGFVLSIASKTENDLSILKGRVKHSQKMNERAEDAWVLVNTNGKIICAHCTCTAGLSETCSHVGAICFAVSSMSESAKIKSVTDELCKWNVPSFKEVSMSEAVNITWKSSSSEQKTTDSNFRLYCDTIRPLSEERIIQFIEKCNSDGDTTALETILFPGKVKRKTNIRDEVFLASLYNENYRNKTRSQLVELGKAISLNITDNEVKEISQSTLLHLKSKCRLGLRRGRITGSQFKSCCVANIDTPSISLISQLINPTNLDNVPSIKYQMKHKKTALDEYKRIAIFEHDDFAYNNCGLIINPRTPYFAGSNDGIISCTCHGNGCLEIKCLKILESNPSFEVLTNKPNNILNKNGNLYVLEKSHELYYQVQLQINLISLNYCDLVIWSPKEFLLITVETDVNFWKSEMKKALTFHEQVVMPELLGKFYTKYKDSETNKEEEKLQLIGLEIEILCSDEEQTNELGASGKDIFTYELPTSSQLESEKGSEIVLPQESKSNRNVSVSQKHDLFSEIGDFNVRNLMKDSIKDILATFAEHEEHLKRLYDENIKELKRHYRAKDIPYMIALDIVSEQQLQAMAKYAETKLACDLEEEHNSSDVIFDAILPEWALAMFCKKFNFSKSEALRTLDLQSKALINRNVFDV